MEASALDAGDLVERLWREAAVRDDDTSWLDEFKDVERLEHSSELRELNRTWPLEVPTSLPRLGPAWKHRAKDRVARVVLSLLDRYFSHEREFLAHVTRFDNQVAAAHDELADQVRSLAEELAATSRRLRDRDELLHRLLEQRIERLEARSGVSA